MWAIDRLTYVAWHAHVGCWQRTSIHGRVVAMSFVRHSRRRAGFQSSILSNEKALKLFSQVVRRNFWQQYLFAQRISLFQLFLMKIFRLICILCRTRNKNARPLCIFNCQTLTQALNFCEQFRKTQNSMTTKIKILQAAWLIIKIITGTKRIFFEKKILAFEMNFNVI